MRIHLDARLRFSLKFIHATYASSEIIALDYWKKKQIELSVYPEYAPMNNLCVFYIFSLPYVSMFKKIKYKSL